MLDIRSQRVAVNQDRRHHPRLEFHCTAKADHIPDILRVTDLSLSGLFLETENKTGFEPGRIISLAIKFPSEEKALLLQAKIADISKRGIGCHFVDLSPKNAQAIQDCFETFRDTLPLNFDES